MTENTVQDVMPPDVKTMIQRLPRLSALAIPYLYWTAANSWIMWNASRWTDGMSRQ